jgi:hypothetical protein
LPGTLRKEGPEGFFEMFVEGSRVLLAFSVYVIEALFYLVIILLAELKKETASS